MTSPRAQLRADLEEQLDPAPGDISAASSFMARLTEALCSPTQMFLFKPHSELPPLLCDIKNYIQVNPFGK